MGKRIHSQKLQPKVSDNLIADSREIMMDVPDNLIAESGSTSLQYYKASRVSIPFGEQPVGPKSNFPPKPLPYNNAADLAEKLYAHFVFGQGQPIEVDLGKFDFSDSINIQKLLPKEAQALMMNSNASEQALAKAFGKKLKVVHKGDFTYIEFLQNFKEVRLQIPEKSFRFVIFGRMAVDMQNVEIMINHKTRHYWFSAELIPKKSSEYINKLDDFDFNGDNRGGWKEVAVQMVHNYAPPGSTSFKIYAKPGSYSIFTKNY